LREVSGVCTHPHFQGRGLARRLVTKLIARQVARGETPFLHVMRENAAAHALYERMGFRDYRETVVRVVSLTHDADTSLHPSNASTVSEPAC
jgi:predicted GNAT family acetyltransferase